MKAASSTPLATSSGVAIIFPPKDSAMQLASVNSFAAPMQRNALSQMAAQPTGYNPSGQVMPDVVGAFMAGIRPTGGALAQMRAAEAPAYDPGMSRQQNALATYGGPTREAAAAMDYGTPSDPLAAGIIEAARSLGVDPIDLATAISYETAGTFDPTKAGPTTQWGQHRGLIQFGEPQAQEYGVNWDDPLGSQLGENGAVAKYLRDRGVKPGMGLLDIYSTINAGAPGLYNRSDANNGGAPGTVADKVREQMSGHRAKAEKLFAGRDFEQRGPMPELPEGTNPRDFEAPRERWSPPQGRMDMASLYQLLSL